MKRFPVHVGVADPDGVVWEAFLTEGESTTYGASPDLEQLASPNAAEGACCAPPTSSSPPLL